MMKSAYGVSYVGSKESKALLNKFLKKWIHIKIVIINFKNIIYLIILIL